MPRVSYAFFLASALFGLAGMYWGSVMGESGDHSMLAGHAHLNLIGWLGMAVMGTFYALSAGRYPGWLAWLNFVLTGFGALSLSVAMAYIVGRGDESFVPLVVAGSTTLMLGMACLIAAILLAWRSSARAPVSAESASAQSPPSVH